MTITILSNVGTAPTVVSGSSLALSSTEQNTTPITDTGEGGLTTTDRHFAFFTIGTTGKLYVITGIEWKNGTVVAGNMVSGVSIVDANPPVAAGIVDVALATAIAQAGVSAIQRNSIIRSSVILGGTILGAWIKASDATAQYRLITLQPSQNQFKVMAAWSADQPTGDNTAWSALTTRLYIKVYFKEVVVA